MPLRTPRIAAFFLFAVVLIEGCSSGHQGVTNSMLPGAYTFESDAPISVPPSKNEPRLGDELILQGDGTYRIERRNRSEELVLSGHWRLSDGNPSTVYLDHAGYPVRLQDGNVRLVVNDDVDARYEKLK